MACGAFVSGTASRRRDKFKTSLSTGFKLCSSGNEGVPGRDSLLGLGCSCLPDSGQSDNSSTILLRSDFTAFRRFRSTYSLADSLLPETASRNLLAKLGLKENVTLTLSSGVLLLVPLVRLAAVFECGLGVSGLIAGVLSWFSVVMVKVRPTGGGPILKSAEASAPGENCFWSGSRHPDSRGLERPGILGRRRKLLKRDRNHPCQPVPSYDSPKGQPGAHHARDSAHT